MSLLNRAATRDIALEILCADYACEKIQFTGGGTHVVIARDMPGRRRYPFRDGALQIATWGRGTVIACSPDRLEWVETNLARLDREAVFSAATLGLISDYVAQKWQVVAGPDLKFLCAPETFRPCPATADVEIELVNTGEGIAGLYAYKGFNDALGYRLDSPRPDMLAAVARHNGQITGIAGASADSDLMWQIGINVLEPFQGRGTGAALVSCVTEAIMAQGKVPYYSTALTNLRSSSIAVRLGYWLAWLEVFAR